MTTTRARELTTRVRARVTPAEIALGAVLVAGAGLRIWLMHAWRPAFLGYPDAIGYIDAARLRAGGLVFWNPYRPAGYPLFLSLMHGLHGGLAFAIDVQHVMGLVIAVLLYLAVARFVRRRWVALLPAIVVAFSGTEIYLEHSALSEALYTLLVVGAIWCAAHSYGIVGVRELLWLAGAGLLIGLSGPVRSTGVLIAPALIGWAAATRPGWPIRLRAAAVVTVAFAVGLGSYLVYQHSVTGTWGLTHTTGETLYARTAMFADCRDFKPPSGTRALCQPPGAARTGATQYMFAATSPAPRLFGLPPDPRNGGSYSWPADHKLEQFAIAAITHQPWDYAWTTLQGLVKYVDPNWGTPNMLELSHTTLIPTLHNLQIEGSAAPELAAYYPGHPVVHHSLKALDSYAQAARVEGPFTVVLAVLMLAGFVLARGPRRAGAGLFGWTTVVMIVAPVTLLAYGARYATPAYGPLAAGAAIGVDEVAALLSGSLSEGRLARVRARRGRTRAARSPASG